MWKHLAALCPSARSVSGGKISTGRQSLPQPSHSHAVNIVEKQREQHGATLCHVPPKTFCNRSSPERPPFTVFVCSRVSRTLFPWKKRCTTLQALLARACQKCGIFLRGSARVHSPSIFRPLLSSHQRQRCIHSTAHLHFLRVVIGLW